MLRCAFATPSHFPSFIAFCFVFFCCLTLFFVCCFFHHQLGSRSTRLAASGAAQDGKLMVFVVFFLPNVSRRCGLMHKQPHLAVGSTDLIESLSYMMMGGRFPTTAAATTLISHIRCSSTLSPLNTGRLAGGRILV